MTLGQKIFHLLCALSEGPVPLSGSHQCDLVFFVFFSFAHPALWGSAPTCLSYVASMDTLLSWQRAGKFSLSTQKEKEETTCSFWASGSTIVFRISFHSLSLDILDWFLGRSLIFTFKWMTMSQSGRNICRDPSLD